MTAAGVPKRAVSSRRLVILAITSGSLIAGASASASGFDTSSMLLPEAPFGSSVSRRRSQKKLIA
ncbi:hypothetical protein D3C87_2099550 [compost metagenome]